MDTGARSFQLPVSAGVGLRAPHYFDFAQGNLKTGFLEIHPENYFGGGLRRAYLEEIAGHYPISFHCVGLSLGSVQRPALDHLKKLKNLMDAINPAAISDHVSWSASGNAHLNDLLPLPYTPESLRHIAANIDHVQNFLGRQIAVENPSVYACFKSSPIEEPDFINQLVALTGCGILLDINNIFVNACNNGIDATRYLNAIDGRAVSEIHLAGHRIGGDASGKLRIDTHDHPVCAEVWELYAAAIERFGPRPTLIEWDAQVPPIQTLLNEAEKASIIMRQAHGKTFHAAA